MDRTKVAWWLAHATTSFGWLILGFSDRLAGGKYRDDMSCRRWYAEFVWRTGYFFYEIGCGMYGELLKAEAPKEPKDD